MRASVIRPGLLVSLKTSLRGGVNYKRVDIEREHTEADGARVAKWETTREVVDPTEHERATDTRSKARGLVAAVCCPSAFGLLCPTDREAQLAEAIEAARRMVDEHNRDARLSRVDVYCLVGRVAQDDAEAARAIASEVRELLDAMRNGIKDADPEAIREAANKARALGAMLTDDVSGKVADAIEQARKAARVIVSRVEKAGESAARVVSQLNVRAIEAARFAFLDLDAEAKAEPIAPAGRGLDIADPAQDADDDEPEAPTTTNATPLDLDIDADAPRRAAASYNLPLFELE